MNFKIVLYLVIITRALDGLTTYLATPNLQYELNPIVQYFNLGWIGFIVLGFIFTIFVLWLSYYSFNQIIFFDIKANSLKKYVSIFLYGKPNKLGDIFAIPRKQQLIIFVGQVFPISLIYYSVFLIINNIFIFGTYHNEFLYSFFFKIHSYHNFIVSSVPITIFLVVSYFFMYKKYKTYNLKD
ncbi:MAG: hypothetical protein COB15_07670 [Flavobacteriales bacterium]|nr:MAG: hypothetical protein COB15_07670 [Flavobacteriales bacterium]